MEIKKIFVAIVAVAMLLVSCQQQPMGHNTLTARERAEGWQLLFDGETFNGWRNFNRAYVDTNFWIVVDGTLHGLGGGGAETGYLITDREFENFILDWDWKISPGANSGMFYHVQECPRFSVPFMTGPEFQIIDDHGFRHPLPVRNRTGSNYGIHSLDSLVYENGLINPPGEWNNSRIVFDNGHVEHWINGEKVLEFQAWTDEWFEIRNRGFGRIRPEYGLATRGVFALQDHGNPAGSSPVWFRNMKIKELPRQTREVNLFNGVDLHGWQVFGDPDEWFVENGLLVMQSSGESGEFGYLATREYFDDFDLTVEFKQETDGNSGVFFRSIIEPVANIRGLQAEVAPMGHGTAGIFESGGRGWIARITEEQEKILREGEWNTMRVLVQGGSVTTWLNGYEMVSIVDDERIARSQGRIALQIHAGGGIRVLWRNLHLTTL